MPGGREKLSIFGRILTGGPAAATWRVDDLDLNRGQIAGPARYFDETV